MRIAESEIHHPMESLWETALQFEVQPCEPIESEEDGFGFLTGCVHIAGARQGAVLLKCSVALAWQATACMFGLSPEAVTQEETRDALGELTNMTGGNIKNLLPSPLYLSLPAVADGDHHSLRVLDTNLVVQAAFRCQNRPFVVSVLELADRNPRSAQDRDGG